MTMGDQIKSYQDVIHPNFLLVEDGTTYDKATLLAVAENTPKQTLIKPSQSVKDVLLALMAGMTANRPVVLNRGLDADFSPPDAFRVGILTSGTTGAPKCVWHRLDHLLGRIRTVDTTDKWLLCYGSHSYAGLQIILTACRSGGRLIANSSCPVPDLARVAVQQSVTAISATPSFWRMFLMTLKPDDKLDLSLITLGGEAVDDALLQRLRQMSPKAALRHIYASTEAGAAFAVKDGRAGFPKVWLDEGVEGVKLKISDGLLHIQSPRAGDGIALWHNSGDRVGIIGDRVIFQGRDDSILNIGGDKVDLEGLEARVLAIDTVRDARLYGRANPITGFIVEAEIVTDDKEMCQLQLAEFSKSLRCAERPRRIHFVDHVTLGPSGKKGKR